MDKFLDIFVKLGVDQSIFYQFAIFTVIFFLLKTVFFSKLLFVLQTRENKTTKLEDQASSKFKEAEKLSQKFDEQIQVTNEEAHQKLSQKKNQTLKEIMEKQKSEEKEVLTAFEEEKGRVIKDIENQRDAVLAKADDLSKTLIEKLVN